MVRHGQASFGSEDYDCLSSIGEHQSVRLGQYFARQHLVFDRVLIGTMRRHRQTAERIFSGMGAHLPWEALPGLDEYDFESLFRAASLQYPELSEAATGGRKEYYRGLKRVLHLWANDQISALVRESWHEFQARVADVRRRLQTDRRERVLVITSGGVIGAHTQQVLSAPPSTAIELNLQIHNSSVSRYYFGDSGFALAGFNGLPHLDLRLDRDLVTYG